VHDLVIDNARVIDGLGGPAREGSLAVKDGRIAAIGAWVNGVRTVDESGLVRDCGRPGQVLRDFAP